MKEEKIKQVKKGNFVSKNCFFLVAFIFIYLIIFSKVLHSANDVRILEEWLNNNFENPYPTQEIKLDLARKTSLTYKQVQEWFYNVRKRKVKKSKS